MDKIDFHYWLDYPTLTIPNFILALIIWTFFGRFILDMIIPVHINNYISRFFHKLTNPFIYLFRPITPRFLHPLFVLLYIPFLLFVLRILNFIVHYQMGVTIIPENP